MKKIVIAFLLISLSALAKQSPQIAASETIVYAPLEGSAVTAGYGRFRNETNQEITLALKSMAPFKKAETHETIEKDGLSSMKKVEAFLIPAQGFLLLKPGGGHMMLFDPSRKLQVGEELSAQFSVNGQPLKIKFKVIPRS